MFKDFVHGFSFVLPREDDLVKVYQSLSPSLRDTFVEDYYKYLTRRTKLHRFYLLSLKASNCFELIMLL
jgi:hypothetical protein